MAQNETSIPLSNDEVMRKLLKPNLLKDHVVAILKKSYVDPTSEVASSDDSTNSVEINVIKQLDSYDDCNFHVSLNGVQYVLKIHNGVESKDYIRSVETSGGDSPKAGHSDSVLHYQNALLKVLHENHISSNIVIEPIESIASSQHTQNMKSLISLHSLPVVSGDHSPFTLAVRLLSWVEGRPMSTLPTFPIEVLADAGRFLGRMHTAFDSIQSCKKQASVEMVSTEVPENELLLDNVSMVAGRRFHQWDGKNFSYVRQFVKYIENEERRRMVESILDTFDVLFVEQNTSQTFRIGINHGDFNDANILLDDKSFQVSGVIDFGDSVESWRVLDIAVAMAYALLTTYGKPNRSISAAAAMLRGYNVVYPLHQKELDHVFLLMVCRLACSCTIGAFSYHQNPGNTYLLLHSAPAWSALELLWGHTVEYRDSMAAAVQGVFSQACSYSNSIDTLINCTDIMLPDPVIPDLLRSVRQTQCPEVGVCQSDAEDSKSAKKRRLTDDVSDQQMATITFVTGNPKKLEEVKRLLGFGDPNVTSEFQLPFILTNKKLDLPELQGDAFHVAKEKCLLAAKMIGGSVIVEDTSLCFNALNGMPGVYIKWFLDACGHDGLNKMISAYEDKSAYAQTVVAYSAGPGHEPIIFEGRTSGKIVMPRGKLDFGWDPIFQPDEGPNGMTYAEMSKVDKDLISHRSRAFKKLQDHLTSFHEKTSSKFS